jgi:2-desacetyl-2-hydroxyethyl bacteriochlorophyllide A dehydrogenase
MSRDAKREAWWWFRARVQAVSGWTGLTSARAVVFTAPGVAELLPVEVPVARRDEVTVEIATSVISPGTERAFYLQLPNTTTSYPFLPGYSAAGVVLSGRTNGSGVEPGDRVAVRNVGHSSVATAPADAVHPVPDGVSLEDSALVQVGVICGHGVRRAAIERGERVVVVGAGLIGTVAARLARAEGAGPVTVIAKSRVKQSAAPADGTGRFLSSEEDMEDITALAAPVVIDATGDPAALGTAVAAAGDGARIVLLGSSRGLTHGMPTTSIRAKRVQLIGAHVQSLSAEARLKGEDLVAHEALTFLDHLAAGRLTVADLLDEVVDPREASSFYRRLASARDLVCARYDWTVVPREERVRRARLLRPPAVSARGIDMGRRPLRARRKATHARDSEPGGRTSFRTMRVGLLGCGDIAVLNAEAIAATPNTALVACFDPVESLAYDIASAHGADACTTSDALLERADVDAVLLCVPHHLHLELGKDAAEAGKHVIVEKPLANDLSAGRALVEATDRAGVSLSVCFPHRYDPDVVEARRLISEGAVGEVMGMLLTFSTDKPPSYWSGGFSGRAQTDWRRSRERAGGGVLIMNLSHYVDLFRHLTGLEADTVTAQLHAEEPSSEVEDTISITVRYTNGAVGSLLGASAMRGMSSATELRLWGREGHIAVEPEPLVYTQRAAHGLRTGRWHSFGRSNRVNIRTEYFNRLATTIAAGQAPEVTGADGLAVQAFIEAAYRSTATGTSVGPRALLGEEL